MKSILFAFLFVSSFAFSQQTQIDNLQDVFTLKNDIAGKYNASASKAKGSPFIHSEYQNIIIEGNAMKGKYNANQDYIELDKDGKKAFFEPAIEFRYEVIFTDLDVTYQAFEYEKFKYGFFKISAKKDNSYLLVKEFIKLIPEVVAKTSFDTARPAKFDRKKDVFYIKFSDQDLVVELPTSKSKFLKVFKDKANDIKNFIKKERLNIKVEEDIVKIFNHYNTL